MDWQTLLTLVSAPVILITWAMAEAGVFLVPKGPDGKLPRLFMLIPIIGGFMLGLIHYGGFTPTDVIKAQTWGKTLALSLFEGFLTAAVAIIVFEIRKQLWARFWPKSNPPSAPGS